MTEQSEPKITEKTVLRLIETIKLRDRIKLLPAQEFSDLLCNEVWGILPLNTQPSELVDEAIDRLDAQAREIAELREQLAAKEQRIEKLQTENKEQFTELEKLRNKYNAGGCMW